MALTTVTDPLNWITDTTDRRCLVLGAVGLVGLSLAPALMIPLGIALYVGAVFFRPWVAIPLIVLTLPFHLHPRLIGEQELAASEIAILAAAVAVLGRAVADEGPHLSRYPGPQRGTRHRSDLLAEGRKVRWPRPHGVDWFVAGFIACALLSLVVSEYPRQSVRQLRWLICEPIAVFYLARATLDPPRHTIAVLWALVVAGVVASIAGIVALVATGELARATTRAMAPYLSPNHLGIMLSRAGAVALALVLFSRSGRDTQRLGTWASLGVILLGLVRTLSIGAWAGFLTAALTLSAIRGRRTLGVALAGLAFALLVTLVALPAERTLARWDPATGTAFFRIEIWRAAVRMIADHPILGLGLDNFLYAYRGGYMDPAAWREPNISHPHNWMLDFWIQLGLPGLVVAVALLIWSARASVRLLRSQDPILKTLGASGLGLALVFVTHGFVDNSYFLVDAAVVFWVILAILVVSSQASESSGP